MTYESNAHVRSRRSPIPLLVCMAILLICRTVFTPAEEIAETQKPVSVSDMNNLGEAPQFHAKPCLDSCSGHYSGYQWRAHHQLGNVYDCSGDKEVFLDGCHIFADDSPTRLWVTDLKGNP